MNIFQHSVRMIALILLTTLFASCGTTPSKSQTDTLTEADIEQRVQQWLDQARSSDTPAREQHLLAAANFLNLQNHNDWALNILFSIDPTYLNNDDYLAFTQLYGNNAITTGQYFKAQDLFAQARLDSLWETMTQEQKILLLKNRAHVDSILGNYPKSLRERITLGTLLDNQPEIADNNEAIWQDLMVLTDLELRSLQENVDSDELYGWLILATLNKNNVSNLNLQLQQLESWQASWPQHSANLHLPNDLQLLRQLIAEKPTKIALLLPQQGRLATAAAAVRDGFFASYYAEFNTHRTTSIQQYDTSQTSIIEVYNQAVADGAELIIGPLNKEHVATLNSLESLSIPVLALNYIDANTDIEASTILMGPETPEDFLYIQEEIAPDDYAVTPQIDTSDASDPITPAITTPLFAPKLYQFGLATQDEARQIARQAYREGYSRAMIIAPNRDWAKRSINAFTEQWQAQNGEIVARSIYASAQDYSETIKNALLINESEERQKTMRRIVGESMEFEPRRRQDVDMIFLIANPAQARQIKPTLAFHYARQIPVYATNHIYTGKVDAKADRDLNGIRFNTLPWLFDTTSHEKLALENSSSTQVAFKKLNALGVDAFHLYARLPQLERLPKTRIFGSTGALSMNSEGRIVREQIWAQFSNGIAYPLPTIVPTEQ